MMTAQGQSPGLDSLPPTILVFSLTPQAFTLELEVMEDIGVVVVVKGWNAVVAWVVVVVVPMGVVVT
jgi:hypothetical protein